MPEWEDWRHVTKIDPGRPLESLKASLEDIANSGTDSIWISGTQNISRDNVKRLLKAISRYDISVAEELPDHRLFVYDRRVDWHIIPYILNTHDSEWKDRRMINWIKKDLKKIDWKKVVRAPYLILNLDSTVAKITRAFNVSDEDVIAYAITAERFLFRWQQNRDSLLYVECSGKYIRDVRGGLEILERLRDSIDMPIAYGGGIKGDNAEEESREIISILRKCYKKGFVVQGNAVYEEGLETLLSGINGAKRVS